MKRRFWVHLVGWLSVIGWLALNLPAAQGRPAPTAPAIPASNQPAAAAPACNPRNDLVGWFDSTNVAFILNTSATCTYPAGMAAYQKLDEIIDHQILFDHQIVSVPPQSTVSLEVQIPTCAAQLVVFWGELLVSLEGVRYGDRLLSSRSLNGTNYCQRTCEDTQLLGLTGVSEGEVVDGFVIIEALVAGLAPWKVQFSLTGPEPRIWIEQIAPYYFMGKTTAGPNGWNTRNMQAGAYAMTVTYFADQDTACTSITVNFFIRRDPGATPTATPSASPTPTATATSTASPSSTATATGTATPTATSTATASPTATSTATASASPTPTKSPTAPPSASPTPTKSPTPTASPTATNTPTATPIYNLTIFKSATVYTPKGQPLPAAASADGYVKPGDIIVYSLHVTNRGTARADGVMVQDALVPAVRFTGTSNPPPFSVTQGKKQLTWLLPPLEPNQIATITFEAQVGSSIRGTRTVIANSAFVISDQTPLAWSNTTTHIYDPALTPR